MSVVLEHKNHLKYSIQPNGNIEQLFDFLRHTINAESDLYKQLILVNGRYKELKLHEKHSTMPHDIIQAEKRRIDMSLSEIIEQLDDSNVVPDIKAVVTYRVNDESQADTDAKQEQQVSFWAKLRRWLGMKS